MRTRLASIAGSVLLLGLLAGCTGGGGGHDDSAAAPAAGAEAGADYSAQSRTAEDASDGAAQDQDRDREVITTGSATLRVGDVPKAVKQVIALVDAAGGRIDARHETAADDDIAPGAELTLRLPATKTTDAVEALGRLGKLADLSIQTEDVTGTAQDLDARINALQTSVTRLQALLAKAGSTADLLAVEKELAERQGELESMEAERARLSDQVGMSTLQLSVVERPSTGERIAPGGFLGGLRSGWNAFLATLNAIVVAFGALLPWLVVGAGGWFLVRWLLRRRRDAAAAPPAGGPVGGPGPGGGPGVGAGPGAGPGAAAGQVGTDRRVEPSAVGAGGAGGAGGSAERVGADASRP